MRIRDPERKNSYPGWKNSVPGSGIRDKHPGSVTLQYSTNSMCFFLFPITSVLLVLCICSPISFFWNLPLNLFMFLTTAPAVPVTTICRSFSWNLTFLFLSLVLHDSNDQHNLLLFLTFALSNLTVL
jgi:hypothetical protein